MIRNMVNMNLMGLVSDRPLIIESLHDLGVLHLHEEPAEIVPPETASDLKILRGKALGLLEALEWTDWGSVSAKNIEEKRSALSLVNGPVIESIRESLDSFSTRLTDQKSQKADLEGQINSIKSALRTLSHFGTFLKENLAKGSDLSLWWIQRTSPADLVAKTQKKIREKDPLGLSETINYHSALTSGGEAVAAISVNHEFRGEAKAVFTENDCLPWLLPGEFEGMRVDEAMPMMEHALRDIPRRIEEIDRNFMKTRNLWGPKIGALYFLLDEKIEEIMIEMGSETTGEIFRIDGWVPLDEKKRFMGIMGGHFKGRVLIRWREPLPEEWGKVPTALKNHSYFRPFELFLKLMPVISYRGLDPTVLIGVFFPLFSGCMIGDIGYGIIILALALWLKGMKNRPLLSDVGSIFSFTAAWSIFWGVAFGEFFGDLGHRLFHLQPVWLERSQTVLPVMVFTVSLGFAHVLLGFVMGMIQGIRTGHRRIWMERLGNILVLAALLSAMIVVKGWLPKQLFSMTATLLVLGLALLMAGGGMGGLVESLGSIGNILSYMRIAAIGLSSAILAMVATSIVDSLGVSFVGVFMALTIHLLNFVLAVTGSGLHSARLQYVEFLGKFYSGGGTQYKPFSRRKPELWKKR
ncbi:MAG: V-type ATPase 116kDa subunit family protein [Thermovirgaceae bacterium]|nr:V-type ATPase 116kDa subunit family protein [Thermovirgaceae bacterium]